MNWFTIFLRGFLMGACDIVPGISGGTIAFITGIYDRLLSSLGNLSALDWKLLFRGKFKSFLKPLDLTFLIPLAVGIFTAVIFISKLMLNLLENYTSQTLAFFVGLILASGLVLFSQIKKRTTETYVYMTVGLMLGIVLSFLPTQALMDNPGFLIIAIGGFIAITAMILPGVSGSFLLLVMGLYVATLEAIHSFDIAYLAIFAIGAIFSLLIVTRFIKKLLKKKRSQTMSLLTGLVIGALLVPLKEVEVNGISALLIAAGILVSLLLSRFGNK